MKHVGKHIAKHHPLYGFEGGVLFVLFVLFINVGLSFYGLTQNLKFLFLDLGPWVKSFFLVQIGVTFLGYATLATALSKSQNFPKLFYLYAALLALTSLIPFLTSHNIYIKSILRLNTGNYYTDILIIALIPYLMLSNRVRITFNRLLTLEDLDLIRKTLETIKKAQMDLQNKTYSTQILHDYVLDQDLFQDLDQLESQSYDIFKPDHLYSTENKNIRFSPLDFIGKHTVNFFGSNDRPSPIHESSIKPNPHSHKAEKRSKTQTPMSKQAQAIFDSYLVEKKDTKTTSNLYIRPKGVRQARLIKSMRRYGKNPAEPQLLKNYHHKPKTESKVKPISVFNESLKTRPASKKVRKIQKASQNLGFSSKFKK